MFGFDFRQAQQLDEEGTLAQLKALRTTGAFCVIRNEPPLSDSPRRA
jgi:hypothetical protein